MSDNPREMLNEFTAGIGEFCELEATKNPAGAFMNLLQVVDQDAGLDTKTKELISVAISVYNRCLYCIVYHTYKALEAGVKREAILQAAMVSVVFGGGPTIAYSVTFLKKCIDEFEKDFQ